MNKFNKNEAQTRLDLIDLALKATGWGVADGSHICVEVIVPCCLQGAGTRAEQEKADYALVCKNQKLAELKQSLLQQPFTGELTSK